MKTARRRLTAFLASLLLGTALLTAGATTPAFADGAGTTGCARYYSFDDVQIQVDNCASGWVWVWGGYNNWATVYVTDGNGQPGNLPTWRGQAYTKQFGYVKSFHVCVGTTVGQFPPIPYSFCSDEVYL
ncbi:hypothetical protein [Streptomyces sp. NPDC094049]|uniref:hypothetical protein n=1 Tax=Streptomyces sp. NPDC094049 TaxID=3154987 RepID=UPI00332C0DE8